MIAFTLFLCCIFALSVLAITWLIEERDFLRRPMGMVLFVGYGAMALGCITFLCALVQRALP